MGYIYLAAERPKQTMTNCRLQIDNLSSTAYDSTIQPQTLRSSETSASHLDHRKTYKKYGSMGFLKVSTAIPEPIFHPFLNSVRQEKTNFIAHLKYSKVMMVLSPDVDLRPVPYAEYCGPVMERKNYFKILQYNMETCQHQAIELTTHCQELHFIVDAKADANDPIPAARWRDAYERSDMDVTVSSNIFAGIDPTETFRQMFFYVSEDPSIEQREVIESFKGSLLF